MFSFHYNNMLGLFAWWVISTTTEETCPLTRVELSTNILYNTRSVSEADRIFGTSQARVLDLQDSLQQDGNLTVSTVVYSSVWHLLYYLQ